MEFMQNNEVKNSKSKRKNHFKARKKCALAEGREMTRIE